MRALTARYWERRNRRSATSPRDSELQGPNSSQTLSPWLLLLLPLVLPNSRFLAIVFWDFKFQVKLFIWYYSISYSFNTGNSKTLEFRILLIMKNKNPRFENLKGSFLAFPPRILNKFLEPSYGYGAESLKKWTARIWFWGALLGDEECDLKVEG